MLVLLKIKDDIITDVRWKTYGCASVITSTSMLSEVVKGMKIIVLSWGIGVANRH
jgi:nitrogen fixation NifU-like protein